MSSCFNNQMKIRTSFFDVTWNFFFLHRSNQNSARNYSDHLDTEKKHSQIQKNGFRHMEFHLLPALLLKYKTPWFHAGVSELQSESQAAPSLLGVKEVDSVHKIGIGCPDHFPPQFPQ